MFYWRNRQKQRHKYILHKYMLYETVGWRHQLDGPEFEQALGVADGQGSLVCYSPWCCKESDVTEWLNWTDIYYTVSHHTIPYHITHTYIFLMWTIFKVFIEFFTILFLFYVCCFGHEACGILASWSGIEPISSALEGEVLTTGPQGIHSLIHTSFFKVMLSLLPKGGEKVGSERCLLHITSSLT